MNRPQDKKRFIVEVTRASGSVTTHDDRNTKETAEIVLSQLVNGDFAAMTVRVRE